MRVSVLLALLAISATSCKKEKSVSTSDPIIGKWNLVLTTGGFAGIHQTPAQSGHTKALAFYTNGSCNITNDATASTTTFSLKDEYSADYQKTVRMLYLSGSDKYIINYIHDTMTVDMNAVVDGTTEWYVKE